METTLPRGPGKIHEVILVKSNILQMPVAVHQVVFLLFLR